jgi:hypothetical protein
MFDPTYISDIYFYATFLCIECDRKASKMSQVQCLPVGGKNMSKVKKILEEARELQTREIDLVDRNISSFDELPGICKYIVILFP